MQCGGGGGAYLDLQAVEHVVDLAVAGGQLLPQLLRRVAPARCHLLTTVCYYRRDRGLKYLALPTETSGKRGNKGIIEMSSSSKFHPTI